jgi:hypothetical protein
VRRVVTLVASLLLLALGAPPTTAAEDPVNQFRFVRQSSYRSDLTFSSPALTNPLRLRAGSGTISDECAINFGWLPRGAYDVRAHDIALDGEIAGIAWELSERQCYDGTFRTDLLIHSEMSADGGQDDSWESHVWTDADPADYTSFGCIKVSYEDVLVLERVYQEAEESGYRAELVVL